MYKTLSQKLNSTVSKVISQYRKDKKFAVPYIDKNGKTKYRIFYDKGFCQRGASKFYSEKEPFFTNVGVKEPTLNLACAVRLTQCLTGYKISLL